MITITKRSTGQLAAVFGICAVLVSGIPFNVPAATPINDLATQTRDLLNQRCGKCHGASGGAYTDEMLIERTAMVERQKVVNLDRPDESPLIKHVLGSKRLMPPANSGGRLSKDEVDLLTRWIRAGAPDWRLVPLPAREFVTTDAVLSEIEADVNRSKPLDRPFLRYFTLTHLVNAKATEEEITAFQTALSKLINSLSWDRTIRVPTAFGPEGSIQRIDLRHYEWSAATWQNITTNYPYALTHPQPSYARIRAALRCETPFIRADWFLSRASSPPLYETILGFTDRTNALRQLERERLRVDTERNLSSSPGVRVWRSGFVESGVSENNRIVERHASPYGAYWKSYDFQGNTGHRDIIRYPKSFRHDGGEMIFNLPNGLQGYLLVNQQGHLLDKAPVEIVRDRNGLSPEVSNGLSCMGCHSEGMRALGEKAGQVRESILKRKNSEDYYPDLLALYAEAATINRLVEEDRKRFIEAVEQTGSAPGGREPILRLVERFARSLDLNHAAAELGLPAEALQRSITDDEALRATSLRLLTLPNGTIKRDLFERLFSRTASQLGLGVNPMDEAVYQRLLLNSQLDNLDSYFALGLLYATGKGVKVDFRTAIEFWKTAAKKDHIPSCLMLGRLLATSDTDRLRDGRTALEYAVQATKLTHQNDWRALDTLAAAYAEVGMFTDAVKWQNQAIVLLGQHANRDAFVHRLSLYQERKRLRIPWDSLLAP